MGCNVEGVASFPFSAVSLTMASKVVQANRFRFESTRSQFERLDIDVNVRIDVTLPAGAHSFTSVALEHWQELCCTHTFVQLSARLRDKVHSLPQILLHVDEIVSELLTAIEDMAPFTLPPLLAILGCMAQDVGADFLKFFPRVMKALVVVVDESSQTDPALLGEVFELLAKLMKLFSRYFVADILRTVQHVRALCFHRKLTVRRLTSKLVGFLLRRGHDSTYRAFVYHFVGEGGDSPQGSNVSGCETMAVTIFHSLRGVNKCLHSRARDNIRVVISSLIELGHGKTAGAARNMLTSTFRLIFQHVGDSEDHVVVWALLKEGLSKATRKPMILHNRLSAILVLIKHISSAAEANEAFELVVSTLEVEDHGIDAAATFQITADIIIHLSHLANSDRYSIDLRQIPWLRVVSSRNANDVFYLIQQVDKILRASNMKESILHIMLLAAFSQVETMDQSHAAFFQNMMDGREFLNSTAIVDKTIVDEIFGCIRSFDTESSYRTLAAIHLLPLVRAQCKSISVIVELMSHSLLRLGSDTHVLQDCLAVFAACVRALVAFDVAQDSLERVLWDRVVYLVLQSFSFQYMTCTLWGALAPFIAKHASTLLSSPSDSSHILDVCLSFVTAPSLSVGLACVRILSTLNETSSEISQIRDEIILLEKVTTYELSQGSVLSHIRHITSQFARMSLDTRLGKLSDFQRRMLIKASLACLRIRLTPLWSSITNYIACLGEFDLERLHDVIDQVESTVQDCLNGTEDRIKHITCGRSTLLIDDCTITRQNNWSYLEQLLVILKNCSGENMRLQQSFVEFVHASEGLAREEQKSFRKCLIGWLELFRTSRQAASAQSTFKIELEKLISHRDTEIALAAISCIGKFRADIDVALCDYLKLLADPSTFRKTLVSRPCIIDDKQDSSVQIHSGSMPLLVKVLMRHINGPAKSSSYRSALSVLAQFDIVDVLPIFSQCLLAVLDVDECRLRQQLHKTLTDEAAGLEWVDMIRAENMLPNRILPFCLSVERILAGMFHHFQRLQAPFVIAIFKIHAMTHEMAELSAEYRAQRIREAHKISARILAIMLESLGAALMPYWHFIHESMMKQQSILHDKLKQPCVAPYLRIVVAISNVPELLFAPEEAEHPKSLVLHCLGFLSATDVSVASKNCILEILHNVLACLDHDKAHVVSGARDMLCRRDDIFLGLARQIMNTGNIDSRQQTSSSDWGNFEKLSKLVVVRTDNIAKVSNMIVERLLERKRKSDIEMRTLMHVFSHLLKLSQHENESRVLVRQLAPLFEKLSQHCARIDLITLYKVAKIDIITLNLVQELHAMLPQQIDGIDYESRRTAYLSLDENFFQQFSDSVEPLLPIIYHCLHDLRSADTCLRDSSRNALSRMATYIFGAELAGLSRLRLAFRNVISQRLKSLLMHANLDVRTSAMQLLQHLIQVENDELKELKTTLNSQFFENATHLQPRAHAAALRSLKVSLRSKMPSQDVLQGYILPIIKGFVISTSPDVVETALAALAEVVPGLTFVAYSSEVRNVWRRRNDRIKSYERYLSFLCVNVGRVGTLTSDEVTHDVKHEFCSVTAQILESRIDESINASPSVFHTAYIHAYGAILHYLTEDEQSIKVRALSSKFGDAFASKYQETRDSARAALNSFLRTVPSSHVLDMLNSFISRLDQGSVLSVRMAVICSILQESEMSDADFSAVLPMVLKSVVDGVFSRSDSTRPRIRYNEVGKSYASRCILLVFSRIHDVSALSCAMATTLRYISNHFAERLHPTLLKVTLDMRNGLQSNKKLKHMHVIRVFFSILCDCMENSSFKHRTHGKLVLNPDIVDLVARFCLSVLSDVISLKLSSTDEYVDDVGEGVPLLIECLARCQSWRVPTLVILQRISDKHAHTLKQYNKAISERTLAILRSDKDANVVRACFNLLVALLKNDSNFMLGGGKYDFLLGMIRRDLGAHRISKAHFGLLHLLLDRRIVTQEMYALAEQMVELIAKSGEERIRAASSKFIVRFVLLYPMGERKMESIIDSVMSIASYRSVSGRLSGMTTLLDLATKLPMHFLSDRCKLFLVFWLAKLSSETDRQCRNVCLNGAVTILRRTSVLDRDDGFTVLQASVTGNNNGLRCAGLQILTATLGQVGKATDVYASFEVKILERLLDSFSIRYQEDWLTIHSSLCLVEKAAQLGHICLLKEQFACALIECLLTLLTHDHYWVQKATIRVLHQFIVHDMCKSLYSSVPVVRMLPGTTLIATIRQIIDLIQRNSADRCDTDEEAVISILLRILLKLSTIIIMKDSSSAKVLPQRASELFSTVAKLRSSRKTVKVYFRWIAGLVMEFQAELGARQSLLRVLIANCCTNSTHANVEEMQRDVLDCIRSCVPVNTWKSIVANLDNDKFFQKVLGKRPRCD